MSTSPTPEMTILGAPARRSRVVHLMPYDGIGGVEEAAKSIGEAADPEIDFRLAFIFPNVSSREQRAATFNPFQLFSTAWSIAVDKPDLLIVSLWRSAIVGILVRLLNRRIRLVVFIHNAADAHVFDAVFTRLAIRMADAVWADAAASLSLRFKQPLNRPMTAISFLVRRLEPLPATARDVMSSPVFAFWGRLSPQKDVGRAIRLFRRIRDFAPDARFRIIGPDGGEERALRALSNELGLTDAVEFIGPMPFSKIPPSVQHATFYLQTSRYEGMAVSVTEAMQLGLIPIVTPVGEIASYCKDDVNAVVVGSDADAVLEKIAHLLRSSEACQAMSRAAISTWAGKMVYAESVMNAVRTLLASSKHR